MNKIIRISVPFIIAFLFVGILICLVGASSQVLASEDSFSKLWVGKDVVKLPNETQTTLLVTTLNDVVDPGDSLCSLREAIEAANSNSYVENCGTGTTITDTINFAVTGVITVNYHLSVIGGGPLIIDGGDVITTSGGGTTRVWWVQEGELTLKSLAVVDGGLDSGAGLYKYSGNLNVIDCTFSNNRATQQGIGGGIYNMDGPMTVTDSIFSGNRAQNPGGGIFNSGTMTITNSIFSGNISDYWGGGIYNPGNLAISNSVFSINHAANAGGGIYNGNTMTITNTVFSGNTSGGIGGGIHNAHSPATISDNTLLGNTATYFGGGISNYDLLSVNSSTFSGNSSMYGGGIFNGNDVGDNKLTIVNSTISDNNAGDGGGICNGIYYGHEYYGTITVTNSTLSDNNADGEGGGLYNYPDLGMATLNNSIITYSTHGGNCAGYPITDAGHNIEDKDTCGFDLANDSKPNSDPKLGVLQDNGGPTWTHALLMGSRAIDAGDDAQCPEKDQRGILRPIDGDGDGMARCDIGSFEAAISPTLVTITGLDEGFVINDYTFTATVGPVSTTLPLTYTWQADGQVPIIHTGGLTDTVNWAWEIPGTYIITVTASNLAGEVADSHIITMTQPIYEIYLPVVINSSGITLTLNSYLPEGGILGGLTIFGMAGRWKRRI